MGFAAYALRIFWARFLRRIFFLRHFQRCLPGFFQARELRFMSVTVPGGTGPATWGSHISALEPLLLERGARRQCVSVGRSHSATAGAADTQSHEQGPGSQVSVQRTRSRPPDSSRGSALPVNRPCVQAA